MWAGWPLLALVAARAAAEEKDIHQFRDGSDLESFVSRPDIRAPRMLVAKHRPEQITEGYWFMTPYSHFKEQHRTSRKEFMPCQTGAHIYDHNGMLIWSGACWGGNRNIFGFRPVVIDNQHFLTMVLTRQKLGDDITLENRNHSGVILDNRYQEVSRMVIHDKTKKWLDFHEFYLLPPGRTALVGTMRKLKVDAPELNETQRKILDNGFREIDIVSGEVLFEWNPLEAGVHLGESYDEQGRMPNQTDKYWDYLHINSVDKDTEGDYLVSARHTSTIYKVSGDSGNIIWRLGGYTSDFEMEDRLNFTWQHDARFLYENKTHTVISVFDNTAEDKNRNPNIPTGRSSAKIMILDTSSKPMTAKMLRRIDRPDGKFSPKLGNVQLLGENYQSANIFVNWAMQGYISEHDAAGEIIFEAKFQSSRMDSYRVYQHSFVGDPAGPPDLKALPIRSNSSHMVSALYVSWNGATKVASWNFYGQSDKSKPFEKVGSAKKMGFETSLVVPRLMRYVYVEAIDERGQSLGRSAIETFDAPLDGEYKAFSPISWTPESLQEPLSVNTSLATAPTTFRPTTQATSLLTTSTMTMLVVNGFALWGFYCAMRAFLQREAWRHYGCRFWV